MLKESVKRLEQFHGVKISRKMIDKIIFYSSCFDYTTCNPDRTISLVDLSMVSAKLTHQKYVTQSAILENFEANFEMHTIKCLLMSLVLLLTMKLDIILLVASQKLIEF